MPDTLSLLYGFGLIPFFTSEHPAALPGLCRAVREGGCRVAELDGTQPVETYLDALCADIPDMAFGIRGVTDPGRLAALGKAAYIALPCRDAVLAARCRDAGIPVFLECSSPVALEAAQRLEPDAVVFPFAPWERMPGYPHGLCKRYPSLRFIFRGPVPEGEIIACLSSQNALACAVPVRGEAVAGDIRRLLRRIDGMELAHVGLYAGEEAASLAEALAIITGGEIAERPRSLFVGEGLELMKRNEPWKGHIAYGTYSVPRLCSRLEQEGIELDYASARYDADGMLVFVYLKDEWGGFRIHLTQKRRMMPSA